MVDWDIEICQAKTKFIVVILKWYFNRNKRYDYVHYSLHDNIADNTPKQFPTFSLNVKNWISWLSFKIVCNWNWNISSNYESAYTISWKNQSINAIYSIWVKLVHVWTYVYIITFKDLSIKYCITSVKNHRYRQETKCVVNAQRGRLGVPFIHFLYLPEIWNGSPNALLKFHCTKHL